MVYEHDEKLILALEQCATRLRIMCINAINAAGSGHTTSCSSCADIMACLFMHVMTYDATDPKNPNNDRFILSKGHAAPVLYASWVEAGFTKESELMQLRKFTSDYEGHPTPRLPFIDVATGSLGQGINYAVGMAYVGKYIDNARGGDYRVFTLLGDGECAEGSVWEAVAFASFYNLGNFTCIIDCNRLGQSQPTALQHDVEAYKVRFESFGFNTYIVDGHNIGELLPILLQARHHDIDKMPTCIIAKTFKGYAFPDVSDMEDWHGKPLGNKSEAALKILNSKLVSKKGDEVKKLEIPSPTSLKLVRNSFIGSVKMPEPPSYKLGEGVATRLAYGNALAKLGKANDFILGFDGDTKNSTFSIKLRDACPMQFCECFIAEQNMVGVGVGVACRERAICFVSTFAAFFTRSFDHIRMSAISQSSCNFVGSHCGVSIGEDGPSQMALEDLAMFRSIAGSVVFYPSDAVSCEAAVLLCANSHEICYIRTGRPNHPVIYDGSKEKFDIGKAKVVKSDGEQDVVTVVAAGVTLHEALKAAENLKKDNISICVIDPFTIKPLDKATILNHAKMSKGSILTVEDHYYEGGLGEAVAGVMSEEAGITVTKMAVGGISRSGSPAELLKAALIDAEAIESRVRKMMMM